MSARPDLSLDAHERDAFLRDVLGDGAAVPCASPGPDGFPDVRLVVATPADGVLHLAPAPVESVPVCVVVERGATYDAITAVVARGTPRDGALALDDVVSFAFAKAPRAVPPAPPS